MTLFFNNMADVNGLSDGAQNETAKFISQRFKSPEKDLQMIFKNLRVDSGTKRCQRKARLRPLGSVRKRVGNQRMKRKTVLQEPTFVYETQLRKQQTRFRKRRGSFECKERGNLKHERDSHSDSELEHERRLANKKLIVSKEESTERRSFPKYVVGCSRQHRRAQYTRVACGSRINFDDTTPEELAAYFDQLLYLPKPMSAMAEMMYT